MRVLLTTDAAAAPDLFAGLSVSGGGAPGGRLGGGLVGAGAVGAGNNVDLLLDLNTPAPHTQHSSTKEEALPLGFGGGLTLWGGGGGMGGMLDFDRPVPSAASASALQSAPFDLLSEVCGSTQQKNAFRAFF
jgi:hypothetical protein